MFDPNAGQQQMDPTTAYSQLVDTPPGINPHRFSGYVCPNGLR
jgi:hypothetical protein